MAALTLVNIGPVINHGKLNRSAIGSGASFSGSHPSLWLLLGLLGERLRDDSSTHGLGRFHAFERQRSRSNIVIGDRRMDNGLMLEILPPQNQRRVNHPWVQSAMPASARHIAPLVGGRDLLQTRKAESVTI